MDWIKIGFCTELIKKPISSETLPFVCAALVAELLSSCGVVAKYYINPVFFCTIVGGADVAVKQRFKKL